MNLIEQLGGYEIAKRELELKGQNSVLQCCIAVTAEMIRDALLEYRRQHNIFEVGDKVVWRKSLTPISSLMEVTDLDGETWGIRHATDAEIEAGKRLEVNHD